ISGCPILRALCEGWDGKHSTSLNAFAAPVFVVIPQRSGGICCCLSTTTEPSPPKIPYKPSMLTRPSTLLRIEESALLLATLFAYQHLHASWLLFALLFLAPDLFMLGYLLNVRAG